MRRKTASLIFHWVWAAVLFAAVVFIIVGVSLGQCPPGGCPGGACPTPQAEAWRPSPLTQPPKVSRQPRPSVVRVLTQDRDGGRSGASGVLVCPKHVLTNEHVVRDSRAVWVLFGKGERVQGTIIKRDATWDLAYLEIAPVDVAPAQFSSEIPQRGETLTMEGYGPGGKQYASISGRVLGFRGPRGAGGDWVEVGAPVRAGDSGGAMFRGDSLVGILWGSDFSKMSVGVQLGRLQLFVEECCQRRPCPSLLGELLGETPLPPAPPLAPEPDVCPDPRPTPPLVQVDQGCRDQLRALTDRVAAMEGRQDRTDVRIDGLVATDQETIILLGSLVDRVEAFEATPGPPGTNGTDGTNGVDGTNGADAVIDYDVLAARVRQQLTDPKSPYRLPPLYIVFQYDDDGTIRDTGEQPAYLGDRLPILYDPKAFQVPRGATNGHP